MLPLCHLIYITSFFTLSSSFFISLVAKNAVTNAARKNNAPRKHGVFNGNTPGEHPIPCTGGTITR